MCIIRITFWIFVKNDWTFEIKQISSYTGSIFLQINLTSEAISINFPSNQ